MIRKIIIAVLTLGAVGCGAAGWLVRKTEKPQFPQIDYHGLDVRLFYGSIEFVYTYCPICGPYGGEHGVGCPFEYAEDDGSFCGTEDIQNPTVFGRAYWQVLSSSPELKMLLLHVPITYFAVVFAIYPTLAFIRGPLRHHRRRKRGLCVTCGYDLRGSPGRCPECGTTPNV